MVGTKPSASRASASVTAAQREFVQSADRFAAAASGTISLAYARPSDPAPFGGALTSQTDAQAVADAVLAAEGAAGVEDALHESGADELDLFELAGNP